MAKKDSTQPESNAPADENAPAPADSDAPQSGPFATNQPELHITDEPNEVTGMKQASVTQEVPINTSSTYPGRDKDLAETDGKLNTVVDLARRAKFAGSQTPAVVAEAGLTDGDGNVNIDDSVQADARSAHERDTAEANRPSSFGAGAFKTNPEPTDDQKRVDAEKSRMMGGK